MPANSNRRFDNPKRENAHGMIPLITRVTSAAGEGAITLDSRCAAVEVYVPNVTQAGAAQAAPQVRIVLGDAADAGETADGQNYALAEADRPARKFSAIQPTFLYHRQHTAPAEFEVIQHLE